MSGLSQWLFGAEIAVVHEFHRPPYGGGNQFLLALCGELQRRGHDVGANRIGGRTRACLFNSFNFDVRRIAGLDPAKIRRVHRVDGPVGTYRSTDHAVDRKISETNLRHADATIFQSRYSMDAHRALGLEFRSPVAIVNAVDPALFHPHGRVPWDPGRKVRLITTSWSDNPNKGFAVYQWMEENLDPARYEYTFVGRSPVRFARARTTAPVASRELGEILRQHDVYVTASLHESCSNGLLEALACGLPALYVESGSNGELVGEGGVGFRETTDIPGRLDGLVRAYPETQAAIRMASLAEVADKYLEVMGLPRVGAAAPPGLK